MNALRTFVIEEVLAENPEANFNTIQGEVSSKLLHRCLTKEERTELTAVIRERLFRNAALEREMEDKDCSPPRANFDVITAYTHNYEPGHLCARNNKAYCERHGYHWTEHVLGYEELMHLIEPRRHPTWYKIKMINALLDRELDATTGGQRKNTRYLVWIDSDAVVIDHARTLESIVDEGKGLDLLIGEDMHTGPGTYINAGVLFVRVSRFSQRFFRMVWAAEAEAMARHSLQHGQMDDLGVQKHYFFVRQFEQSAIQKCLKVHQQGLEFSFSKKNKTGLRAFHTFDSLNAHLARDSDHLKHKFFPNVCVFPCYALNSCLQTDGTLLDDEEDVEGGEGGTSAGLPQRGARFIYHPAGKKFKMKLLQKILEEKGLV